MSEKIHLSVWVPEGEDKVKLVYSDDEVVFVKKEDFNRAFGAIISAENKVDLASGSVRFDLKPGKVFLFNRETEDRISFEVE